MNRAKILLLSIVMSVIVASCGTLPEQEYDWCYTFEFTEDNQGVNIGAGELIVGQGIKSNPSDTINISYSHSSNVFATFARAIVLPVDYEPQPEVISTNVTVVGQLFNIYLDNTETFTAPIDNLSYAINIPAASTVFDNENVVNLTIQSNSGHGLIIERVALFGNGDSPFPVNNCSGNDLQVTPTLSQPLPTSTFTTATPLFTDTPTFTPSPTFTPTNTPDVDTPDETQITYDARTELVPFSHACITPIHSFTRDGVELGDGVSYWSNRQADHTYNAAGYGNYSGGADINTLVSSLTLTIDGYIDMDSLTAGAFITSGASSTNRFEFDFWYNDTLVYDETENQFSTGQITETANYNGLVDKIRIKYTWRDTYEGLWINTFTINGDLFCASDPATETPTLSPTPSPTLSGGGGSTFTPSPTRTPIPFESATPNVTLEFSTATAMYLTGTPATSTPNPTMTLLPSSTPFQTPAPGAGTPTLEPDITAENEAEWEILGELQGIGDFFANIFGGLFDFLSGVFQFIFDAIGAFFALIGAVLRFIIELLEIAVLIIQLILGLINLLLAYMRALIERLALLIATFFTVPPTPIEAMPLCVTDPMSYDICAIYYIMDWTLFAPETPGAFIVPLLLAVMNVIIIMRFAKYVLKIIRRGEDVTR